MALEFGFYPRSYDIKIGDVTISTLPDLDKKVAAVTSSDLVSRDWIYAIGRSRVFGLSKTHLITTAAATNDDRLRFLVWCLGFFTGMRLTTTEAGFIDATPIRPGAMTDIVWIQDSLATAVAGADAFWKKYESTPRVAKIVCGAIHAYFLAQTPGLLEYEQFIYLYMALDGCHAVRETIAGRDPKKTPHGQRIANLCSHFGIVADSAGRTIPSWADPSSAQPPITQFRNAIVHEGLFFDEPVGFEGPVLEEFAMLSMHALVSRLVIALLELNADAYVRSQINSRMDIGVKL